MKTEIQTLIDALRSGKYTKTVGQLRRNDCYCVVGVAADLLDPGPWEVVENRGEETSYSYMGLCGSPPENVIDRYGFSVHFLSQIIRLNDGYRYSFRELADVIEKAVEAGTAFNEEFTI